MVLTRDKSQLLVIDVQERLAPAMSDSEATIAQCARLVQVAKLMDVPTTVSEQYSRGIGPTVPQVREACARDSAILEKIFFSCAREEAIGARIRELKAQGRAQLLVCGIESHVCVLQSAMDFAREGFEVFVAADATSSRASYSREMALPRMREAGISIVTVEMAAFEWLEKAGTADFRAGMALIK